MVASPHGAPSSTNGTATASGVAGRSTQLPEPMTSPR